MTATPRLTGSSTKSWVATTGAFLVVYYLLPTQRARKCYLLMWATALGGLWPGMERVPDQDGTFGDWLGGWDVTVWSFLLWGASIYFLISMYREIFRHRRAVRYYAQPPAQPTVTEVQVVPVPQAAPTGTAPGPGPGPGAQDRPSIIIPTTLMGRRVHRAGTTASGVPIRDRRAVDPSTLRPREHD